MSASGLHEVSNSVEFLEANDYRFVVVPVL